MEWLRGLAHKILQITHGRSTAFFIAFFISGHLLAVLGKLTLNYVEYMSALGAFVLGHSIKEDFAAVRNGAQPAAGPDDARAEDIKRRAAARGDPPPGGGDVDNKS